MQAALASDRKERLDEIAEALPQRAAVLSRLFLRRTGTDVSRTEAGVLSAIAVEPRRITDLACSTGVTQPAITLLVNRLQERGWVTREPGPGDRRVVRVRMTAAGEEAFAALRAEYRALLHREMAVLGDEDVEVLARATQVIDHLIARLESGAGASTRAEEPAA